MAKILIADDDRNICELLRLYLVKEGYETCIANDGEAAVQMYEREKPDLLLLDVMMPRMDGCEAARTIRALLRPDAGTVPVIAVTANAFAEDIAATTAAGMNAHVSKPIDFAVLLQTLEELTGGQGRGRTP